MITKIRKRDGREIYFAPEKITRAIFLAASKVAEDEGQVANYATAEQLTDQVVNYLNRHYQDGIPTVEEIQDAVAWAHRQERRRGHGAGLLKIIKACIIKGML